MVNKSKLDIIGELFIRSCNTKQTIKNKDYQWNVFTDFCSLFGEIPIPVSNDTLVRYCVYLIVQRNCCPGTVRNHLSNIRRYHKLYLNIDIPSPSSVLRRVLSHFCRLLLSHFCRPFLSTLFAHSHLNGRTLDMQLFPTPTQLLI